VTLRQAQTRTCGGRGFIFRNAGICRVGVAVLADCGQRDIFAIHADDMRCKTFTSRRKAGADREVPRD
jgi:hypothetical protein